MSSVLRKTKRRSAICKVIERNFSKADDAVTKMDEDSGLFIDVLAYRDTIMEKFQTVRALDEDILTDLVDKDSDILDMEVELSTEFSVFYRQKIMKLNNVLKKNRMYLNYQVCISFIYKNG